MLASAAALASGSVLFKKHQAEFGKGTKLYVYMYIDVCVYVYVLVVVSGFSGSVLFRTSRSTRPSSARVRDARA